MRILIESENCGTRVNKIPPVDLAQQYKTIEAEVSAAVLKVLASGYYIGGASVENFEQAFGTYIGTRECIACNSGTDALYLALRALGIGPQDEVITTPFTFIATAETISAVGAKPIFVDIDPQTFNLDLNQVAAAITDKTKAIIPVHLFGQPVDMTRLMAIANTHHLAVIEDCAQATGATWDGRKVGSIGHIGCFSFFPTKNLGACGDGGAVTTNDSAIASKIRVIRDHGASRRYHHEVIGINSRLDALQAAILQIKLPHLDAWNAQRCEIATRYQDLLHPLSGIIPPQGIVGGQSVWNQYTIRVTNSQAPDNTAIARDRVRNYLQDRGIISMVYYPIPLHLQPVYQDLGYQPGSLPIAEQASHEVLSLPMFPELSLEQQKHIVYSLKECLAEGL
jgi:dTDP-4-amino-4,6-dideoxygalactose transaminase